jgi:hypothetical protein
MAEEYLIMFHTKSGEELETFGEFFVGEDDEAATNLFSSFQGSTDNSTAALLFVELRKMFRGLPVDSKMIHCTLEELAINCKLIAREAFRQRSLR